MQFRSTQLNGCLRICRTSAVASGILALSVLVLPSAASAKLRVVPFTKAGNWNVQAIYDGAKNRFSHCSASATYRSGTKVGLIAYSSGEWKLQFYKRDWPRRPVRTFPAQLLVDGRSVLQGSGSYRGRSAFIGLGRSITRIKALMRGRVMSIRTPNGTSSFRLDGTFRASVQLARCWKAHNRPPATGGAFASNQGAFGGGASKQGGAFGGGGAPAPRAALLPRGRTLELATAYLSSFKRPYSFLTRDKNILKHFPVNWKFQNGVIGGMKVYQNTGTGAEAMLQRLLAQQVARCKGRSATDREKVLRLKSGRKVHRARAICEASTNSIITAHYRVMRLRDRMLMVVMHVGVKGASGRSNSPLPPGGGEDRLPGPNEL